MRKVDYLIIGQGLAGTNLAFHLLEKGKSILIIDKYREITSSKVAAGLMNPITGKRFAKTWMADDVFPYAASYYKDLEITLNSPFYHSKPIYRYFANIEDQNTWMGRSTDQSIQSYIGSFESTKSKEINADFGGAEILQGGWLDTSVFLKSAQKYFIEHKLIVDESVDYNQLIVSDEKIVWKDIESDYIVFCEGFRAKDNPYFNSLPFTFAKGEIVDVRFSGISDSVIHNKNGFILPYKDDIFKVGATFRWNEMDEQPTKHSLIELKEKISNFTNAAYTIVDQKGSIRPTTKDRRPFIGAHPKHNNLLIFNGFGSKGVTLTPYLSAHFVKYLSGESDLLNEVNINRFKELL